jgi:hypothetical protein
MARVCNQCKAYDAEGTVQTCTTCSLPMQFTLLPPQGRSVPSLAIPAAEPGPAPRGPRVAERGHQFMDMIGLLFRYRRVVSLLMLPLVLFGGYFGIYAGRGSLKSRYDRLEVGMNVEEVADTLMPPSRINRRAVTSSYGPFDAVPDKGYFKMNYNEGTGARITLEFNDAILVAWSENGLN